MLNSEEFLKNIQLVPTSDGSNTIFNPQIGENYHSKHGAYQESLHVFVQSGLQYYLQHTQKTEISILEIGFGTGLNFLLSVEYALDTQLSLNYRGIEAYPLGESIIRQTNYDALLINQHVFPAYLSNYQTAFEKKCTIENNITLKIDSCPLLSFNTNDKYDIIYFDAFAKVHQPDMWTQESIQHACTFLKDKGIFVTYSVTGDLKRQLKSLGFEIERPAGAAGKREMMRATLPYVL